MILLPYAIFNGTHFRAVPSDSACVYIIYNVAAAVVAQRSMRCPESGFLQKGNVRDLHAVDLDIPLLLKLRKESLDVRAFALDLHLHSSIP